MARCFSCCAKHHVEEICFSFNRRVDSKTRVIPCKDIHRFFRLELIEVTQTSLSRWHTSVFISPIQQSLKPDPGGNVSPERLLCPNFACLIFLAKKPVSKKTVHKNLVISFSHSWTNSSNVSIKSRTFWMVSVGGLGVENS